MVSVKNLKMDRGCLVDFNVEGCDVRRGKVRNSLDLGNVLAIVTTDRISAFDVVIGAIPGKGWVLDQTSRFWFDFFGSAVKNHLSDISVPQALNSQIFHGRVTMAKKCRVIPIECVVRGYITGSGWKDYCKTGSVCGIKLSSGLVKCAKLSRAIFTPTTKATAGHDEPITFEEMCGILAFEFQDFQCKDISMLAKQLQDFSIELYSMAADYARERGIIIADTKFEWGLDQDGIVLIDEVLTPDSSRFWPGAQYEQGREQPSFDKQYVRDYLEALCKQGKWDKTPNNVPTLPPEIVANTSRKYFEAYEILTGKLIPDEIRARVDI